MGLFLSLFPAILFSDKVSMLIKMMIIMLVHVVMSDDGDEWW